MRAQGAGNAQVKTGSAAHLLEIDMYFLGFGIVLMLLKFLEIGPTASWDWWVVLAPFGLAVAWWAWADMSGYTKKKAMDRMDDRKQARIDKNREAIGTLKKRPGRK
jgi:small Trp-rich protein